jgi:uncharacterized cupin superfamily protein
MIKPVVHIHDLPVTVLAPDGRPKFGASIAEVGEALGSTGLGAMFVTVEPGKRAFPFHNHLANDEMFIVIEGTGTYRYGDGEHAIKAGDVCYAPKGGKDTAHQIINTGESTLKYLGVSTMTDPDVVEYPDSDKFSVLGIFPGKSYSEKYFGHIGRRADAYDYWDGEA